MKTFVLALCVFVAVANVNADLESDLQTAALSWVRSSYGENQALVSFDFTTTTVKILCVLVTVLFMCLCVRACVCACVRVCVYVGACACACV